MYLQRIELQGFKSFAAKAVLEFPAPTKSQHRGITAIVGPNGSGKSNVVDAVRWVLGEQSLRLLRGKKSTDVIFSGSAKKNQMGLAEASLFLNNEDMSAPIDYSEIVITRRLYRDGSSEYLLNKSEVRLFDILMLLAKSNFGQNTYSIIGQGMIDKIVNYSGAERKEFFDEATGIKQFQLKRDRSVNKLRRSRENLEQARVLINELDPHLKSLTRQVNKLHQRQEIELELKNYQTKYYSKIWHDLSLAYEKHALSFNTLEKQRLRLESRLDELQDKLDKFSQEGSRSEEFNKLQLEHEGVLAQKNEILKDLAVIRGKMDVEYSKLGKQDLSWLENKKVETEQKIKETDGLAKTLQLRLVDSRKKMSDKERALNMAGDELSVWQNNLSIMQDEFYRLRSGGKVNYGWEAVRAILDQKGNIPGIYGTVSDIGKVKNKNNEAALAASAGGRLTAVVVDSDDVAVKCINYLKQNRLGSVTFFPLNKLRDYRQNDDNRSLLSEPGVVGLAVDLISHDSKFNLVFGQIFGSTVVVDSIESAKSIGIGRERMVTLDGDIMEKTGVMKGGYQKKDNLNWSVLEDRFFPEEKIKEIASLKAKIDEQYRDKENIISQVAELKLEVQLAESKLNDFGAELSSLKKEKTALESQITEAQLTPEQQDAYFHDLQQQKTDKEQQVSIIESQALTIREKIDGFNLEEEKKKREVFALQQEMHNLQNELNQANFSLNEAKIELAKIETKKEDIFISMKQDLGEDYQIKNNNSNDDINLEEYRGKIDKLRKQLELIGGIDPEIEKEYNEVKTRYEFLSSQSDDLEKAIKDLEKVVVELDKLIKNQFEEEFKKINKDFSRYFKQLFDGGSSKLFLAQKEVTEAEVAREEGAVAEGQTPEDGEVDNKIAQDVEKKVVHVEDKSFLVNMGIEIEACPPGKKIKNINMLSGGEKTMTALALICAIINNNPSPFILFDEVDAALDESNSAKFSGIIEELSHKTQFITITHNRAIMSRADVLYGVTMQGDGVSRLLSLKLAEAEKIGVQK